MEKVRVNKKQLLDVVMTNRKNHQDLYEAALEGYSQKVREELEHYLDRVKNGEVLQIAVILPKPENHLDDYNRAVRMIEMSVDAEIELKQNEFAQLVMDDWGWKRMFGETVTMYTARET